MQYIPCESFDMELPSVEMSIQKSIKRWLGNKPGKKMTSQWFKTQKANIHRSQNHIKIKSNPVNYHLESILLLPRSPRVVLRCENRVPGCSRGVKSVPQIVRMEAPSSLNGHPRNQKGPAAKGVALGINYHWKPFPKFVIKFLMSHRRAIASKPGNSPTSQGIA